MISCSVCGGPIGKSFRLSRAGALKDASGVNKSKPWRVLMLCTACFKEHWEPEVVEKRHRLKRKPEATR